jgi:hypothetical protein
MKYFFRIAIAVICMLTFVGSLATAQDLQQQIAKLGHDAAVGYITPILAGWGNDLNSGIYYSADLHDILGFDIGVKAAMSRFTDADKTYSLTLPSSISVKASQLGQTVPGDPSLTFVAGTDYPRRLTANTAVGAKDNTPIKLNSTKVINIPGYGNITLPVNQTLAELPGGFDIGALGVPLVMPQFDLGLPFGLEFMLRYIPTVSAGDVGKFNYSGFGLRYSISQWLPLFPVDIAAHFMTQKLNFKSKGDASIFSAKATAYGLEVSKKLLILTLYGGFQLESSTLTLADYQYTGNDPNLINPVTGQGLMVPGFEVKGTDKSRFTVGARLLLLIINVHVEYSVAKNPVIALGAGITLR